MTENNYVRVIQALTSSYNGGFVWKSGYQTDGSLDTSVQWDIFIGGYYFRISQADVQAIWDSDPDNVWLGIKLIGAYPFNELDVSYGLEVLREENPDWDFGIQIKKDGQFNTSLLIENLNKCFTVQSTEPDQDSKIWIDSGNSYIIKVKVGSTWIPCGAVYK